MSEKMSLGYIGDSLPKEWCKPLLTELVTPKQWKTIPTKLLLSEGYTVYGANGKIGYSDQYTHEHPTVMITCRGASCGNLHLSEPFSYINGNAMALDGQLTDFIGLKYLYFALRARGLEDTVSGSAQPQITGKGLAEVRLPLPCLEEQKVITDKLDELLAQVNNLKARLDAIPTILKRFRQSVLAASVSGSLTVSGGYGVWEECKVGDVVKVKNGFAFKSKDYVSTGGIPVVRISDLLESGVSHDTCVHVAYGSDAPGFEVAEGDLLVAMSGATTGKMAIYKGSVYALQNQRVGNLKILDGKRISEDYRNVFFNSQRESILKDAYGGAQPNISGKKIESMRINLPTLEEQEEIVRRVDQLFAFADQVEQQVANAQARVNKLTQSILAKAFRGELTAEWRAANPELISGEHSAAALLERIKAEKAKQTPAKTRRGGRKATVTP